MKRYWVYILASKSSSLYIGVTNDIVRRVFQHKNKTASKFTTRYNINLLVYAEETDDVNAALNREKQLKGWIRNKKIELIESLNPGWRDLSEEWFEE